MPIDLFIGYVALGIVFLLLVLSMMGPWGK